MAATILVVDDEPVIRDLLTVQLEELGYNVVAVKTCVDAVLFCSKVNDVDLVFLDVNMPSIDGYGCLAYLRKTDPTLAIVLMSGRYQSDRLVRHVVKEGVTGYLTKPFSFKQLKTTIDTMLDEVRQMRKDKRS